MKELNSATRSCLRRLTSILGLTTFLLIPPGASASVGSPPGLKRAPVDLSTLDVDRPLAEFGTPAAGSIFKVKKAGRPEESASLADRPVFDGDERSGSAWWRGWWFGWVTGALAAGALAALGGAWYARRRHLYEGQVEDCVATRTREGREQQDRLLQGFIGTLFVVQAARDTLTEHPARAAELLDGALEDGDRAVRDARLAIERRVVSAPEFDDISEAIAALGRELYEADGCDGLEYRVFQEGLPQALRPLLRDGVYGIVRMAVRNAAKFSRPTLIEVELDFSYASFRVRVRDDGQGIEPGSVLDAEGRAGARGQLKALKCRAIEQGGCFKAWSRRRAGTEIELTFSGQRAYSARLVGFAPWLRQVAAKGWRT